MFKCKFVARSLLFGLWVLGCPPTLEAAWRSTVFPVRQILRITSLFGESRGDHFHNGIDFGGVQRVYPIKQAKVLFVKDAADNPMRQEFGTGNVVVLEHDESIRTYYYHLEDGSTDDALVVDENTPLGVVGNTGRSLGAHLHFMVEDLDEEKLLNPLAFLPEVEDAVAPKIHAIMFKINNKLYNLNQRWHFHHQSTPEVFVIASDLKPFYNPKTFITPYTSCGAFQVALRIDGKLLGTYRFDQMSKAPGRLLTSSGQPFEAVYGLKQNYRFGTFLPTKKKHTIEATTMDWNGNVGRATRRVFFIPPQ